MLRAVLLESPAPLFTQPVARELPIPVRSNYGAAQLERNFLSRHSFEHFHLNDRPNGRLDRFQPRETILDLDQTGVALGVHLFPERDFPRFAGEWTRVMDQQPAA